MNKTDYDAKILGQDLRRKLANINLTKLSKDEVNLV